jgi:hypothetical protein
MGRVELVEKLSCRPEFSFFRVFKALADSFLCIGAGGNVEQKYTSTFKGRTLRAGQFSGGKADSDFSNSETAVAEAARRCSAKNFSYKQKRPHCAGGSC